MTQRNSGIETSNDLPADAAVPSQLPDTRILILGGYGNTGKLLAPLLLEHTKASIVLGGRNVTKANALAEQLKSERVTTIAVDASNMESLVAAFQNMTLVIVASSTSQYVANVTMAAMSAKVDYMDIQYSAEKFKYLKSMEEDIKKMGLCFITDGGFHPGLPASLIKFVAPGFAKLEKANVGSVILVDWKKVETSIDSMEEFAGEFGNMQMIAYKSSEWKEIGIMGMMNPLEIDFGEPFGRRQCFPMFLEEMRAIPELYPSIAETGFYVGGFNWFVDWFVSPIVMAVVKTWPSKKAKQTMGRFLFWGLRAFSNPPFGSVLKLEAVGVGSDGEPLVKTLAVSHADAYALTAIPVAATVMQYLSKETSIRSPGLSTQAQAVDSRQLLLDIQSMGVQIEPPPL